MQPLYAEMGVCKEKTRDATYREEEKTTTEKTAIHRKDVKTLKTDLHCREEIQEEIWMA